MEVSKDIQCEHETLVQIIENNDTDALTALTVDDFALQENKYIYNLLLQMFLSGKEITPVNFAIENKDALQKIDSKFNLPDFMHLMVYGDIDARIKRLQEKTNVRKVIALRDSINHSLTKNDKSDAIFDAIEKELIKFQSTGFTRTEITPEKLAETCIETIANRRDKEKLNNKVRSDWQLLKAAAMKLKTMAQQLDLVVIMIAQLNKSGNLAQASQMDQEADLWLNLTRVREEEQLAKMYPFNAIAYVNKARNAENEVALPLLFTGDTLTFISDREEAEEWQKNNGKTITSFDDFSRK